MFWIMRDFTLTLISTDAFLAMHVIASLNFNHVNKIEAGYKVLSFTHLLKEKLCNSGNQS